MAIKAGADTIEHMVFSDDETIDMIVEAGIPVTPTLAHCTDHAIQSRRELGTAEFVLNTPTSAPWKRARSLTSSR